jgi:CHAT domain-containing protein/tetratricopeptide (TPR) repeat protein
MSAVLVNDLLRAPTVGGRLQTLRAEGLHDETGLSWLLDRVEELVHEEPSLAEQLGALCIAAADEAHLHSVLARANYWSARVAAERGELEAALTLIDSARASWSAAGEELSALRTELGRMHILDDLGRHAEAVAVGDALLQTLPTASSDDEAELLGLLEAKVLNNLGAAHSLLSEHEEALGCYARSEAAYRGLGLHHATAEPRANRGIELLALGRAREALAALSSAEQSFAAAGDRLWAAKCAGYCAEAYAQLGQLGDALRVLRPARETLASLGAEAEAARLQLDMAAVYLATGLSTEAYEEAAAVGQQMARADMTHDHAAATFTMALAAAADGNIEQARTALESAASLFTAVGDRQYQARTLLAQADLSADLGREALARALISEAIQQLRHGGWLVPLGWALLRQADLTTDLVERDSALDEAGRLVDELGRPPQLRAALLVRLARRDRDRGQDGPAVERLRDAVGLGQRVSSTLPDWVLRTSYRAAQLGPSDVLLASGGSHQVAEAALVCEQAKAQTLQDLMAGAVTSSAQRRGGSQTGELARCRADLSAAYAALTVADTPARRALVRERAVQLERELSHLQIATAGWSAPDAQFAGSLSYVGPAVAYHVAGDDLDIFVVDDGKVAVRRLSGAASAVTFQLDRLAAQWNRFRLGSVFALRNSATLAATTRAVLQDLHRLLLQPVADLLPSSGPLTVVPHRQLHQVPFHALHDGRRYLVQQRPITVLPTLAVTAAAPAVRSIADGVLVLAVPDAYAPAILDEGRAVCAAVPGGRLLAGEAATSDAIRQRLPGPGALHIACHGLYRPGNPLFSSLRLGDRWVTSTEIMELELGGALVTLSACESGRPAEDTAEPVGLAWAFLAAGASGAVVSQWIVHDDAAAELFGDFYTRLAAGVGPSMALREAQLATAENHPHPYFWAPFSYVASPRPLTLESIDDQN